ncbi:MAG TPA: hypothetical protein VM093_08595 [Aeromicrobium sp.]|nr:hypothetical protein [Aeromicrobium sp.]
MIDGIGLSSHGVGGPGDLPVPLLYSIVGATWALTISFVVLILAWREPKFDGRPDAMSSRRRRPWLAVVGLAAFAWLAYALYAGPSGGTNAGVRAVYIYVWVGLVPLALVAGDVWRDLSPWRSIQAVVARVSGRPGGWLRYPEVLGYWPAAVGVFSFVWMELASPEPSSGGAVRTWVAIYAVTAAAGGAAFGPSWFDRADPLDVYSSLAARLGRWRIASAPAAPGLVAFLGTLVGSTAFDSFSGTAFWQSADRSMLTATLWLLGFCAGVSVLFAVAAMATPGVGGAERRLLPQVYAHSLIPIAIGYVLAHYLTLLLDVLGRYPTPLAVLKVAFVVLGHLLAVVAAHDCALRVLPRQHRTTGQLAMLMLMVSITYTGLFLLLS